MFLGSTTWITIPTTWITTTTTPMTTTTSTTIFLGCDSIEINLVLKQYPYCSYLFEIRRFSIVEKPQHKSMLRMIVCFCSLEIRSSSPELFSRKNLAHEKDLQLRRIKISIEGNFCTPKNQRTSCFYEWFSKSFINIRI